MALGRGCPPPYSPSCLDSPQASRLALGVPPGAPIQVKGSSALLEQRLLYFSSFAPSLVSFPCSTLPSPHSCCCCCCCFPQQTLRPPHVGGLCLGCRCAGARLRVRVVATATRRSNLLHMKGRPEREKPSTPFCFIQESKRRAGAPGIPAHPQPSPRQQSRELARGLRRARSPRLLPAPSARAPGAPRRPSRSGLPSHTVQPGGRCLAGRNTMYFATFSL